MCVCVFKTPNINKLVRQHNTYMTLFEDIEDNFRNLRDTALLQQKQTTADKKVHSNVVSVRRTTSPWIDIIFANEFMAKRQNGL